MKLNWIAKSINNSERRNFEQEQKESKITLNSIQKNWQISELYLKFLKFNCYWLVLLDSKINWTDLRLKNTRCLTTILEKVLFRFDMGMPGRVWADMWHHRINLWLLLNKVYHHAKYGCIYLRSSWDIEIRKMGQSDWLRAFFKISWEPDFS